MADLVQINNFQNKFSENLFTNKALFDSQTTVNFTGTTGSSYSFDSNYSYSTKGKDLNIVATSNFPDDVLVEWDFNDALTYQINKEGLYIFQFGINIIGGFSINQTLNGTLEVDFYKDGLLDQTFTQTFKPFDSVGDNYIHFAQNFYINTSTEIDFKFRFSYPVVGSPESEIIFCIDALQLNLDLINNGYGMPAPYTFPPYTQINGTYDYANSLPSQSFTGTALKINNNGGGANTNLDYRFKSIPNIYNTTTNFLEFDSLELGDKIDIRADITVTTTTANQDVDIYLDVALGTVSNYQIFLCRRNFKTAGTYSVNDISNWLYIGNTDTKDYNCALMFDSDANATVLNNGMVLNVTKRVA